MEGVSLDGDRERLAMIPMGTERVVRRDPKCRPRNRSIPNSSCRPGH